MTLNWPYKLLREGDCSLAQRVVHTHKALSCTTTHTLIICHLFILNWILTQKCDNERVQASTRENNAMHNGPLHERNGNWKVCLARCFESELCACVCLAMTLPLVVIALSRCVPFDLVRLCAGMFVFCFQLVHPSIHPFSHPFNSSIHRNTLTRIDQIGTTQLYSVFSCLPYF